MSDTQEKPVIVVGSGPGGLAAATALVENGQLVVLLERGGEFDPNDSRTNDYNFEAKSLPWETGSKEWQGPVTVQRAFGLGGTSLYFQGLSQMPSDEIIAAWGLPLKKIKSLEQNIAQFLQIAGSAQPAHPLNPISSHLYQSAKKLDWRSRPASVAILSEPHAGRPPCNHCGQCVFGCRPRDKGSMDNTWLPRAKNTGRLQVVTGAMVTKITLSSPSRADGVEFTVDGKTQKIQASAVVAAAGALETPFLLKNSRQHHAPNGLGNAQVGRNLTGSILYNAIYAMHEGSLGHAGIPIDVFVDEFESEGILLCQGRNLAGITGPISLAKFYAKNFGPVGLRSWMRKYYDKLAVLAGFVESDSLFENGIDQGSKKIFSITAGAGARQKVKKMMRLVTRWGQQAKLELLSAQNGEDLTVSGAMLRGTCRLGISADASALTLEGQLRNYENIVVADASVIPPGLIAHPSMTLQVLGYYFGQSLAQRIKP